MRRCATVWLATTVLHGAIACGGAEEAKAPAPKQPVPDTKGATLVFTNADGTEEKVPYRECSQAQNQTLTALVGAVMMKRVGDHPNAVRSGGFTTKVHLAVKAGGAIVFGGATSRCGGEVCPREDAEAIEALANGAVAEAKTLPVPPEAACATSVNVRMQSKLGEAPALGATPAPGATPALGGTPTPTP